MTSVAGNLEIDQQAGQGEKACPKNINVTGALALIQQAARKMVDIQQNVFPESAADIVIIGSVVGRHISPFSAVYGASKFAVHALAEGLRREIGPKGVRVSLVEPGAVHHIVTRPPHVHVSNIVVRPPRQDSP
jgi:short-subunit dehydrogenase